MPIKKEVKVVWTANDGTVHDTFEAAWEQECLAALKMELRREIHCLHQSDLEALLADWPKLVVIFRRFFENMSSPPEHE